MKSIRMTAQQNIAALCWNNEEEAFRETVAAEANAANEQQERELETLRDQPQNAKEYDLYVFEVCYLRLYMLTRLVYSALKSAGPVLHSIAQALSQRYGMVVSILMAGPIGEDNGEIGVRR